MNKRGISAIVATVLIILIVVGGVAIIWAAIIPMIRDNISFNDADGRVEIVTSAGYTVYDESKNVATVQVKRVGEADISGVRIIFDFDDGSSLSKVVEAPGINGVVTYSFDVAGKVPKSVKVAPIFVVNEKDKEGSISSNVDLKKGKLVNVPDDLLDLDGDGVTPPAPECTVSSVVADCGGPTNEFICDGGEDVDERTTTPTCVSGSCDSDVVDVDSEDCLGAGCVGGVCNVVTPSVEYVLQDYGGSIGPVMMPIGGFFGYNFRSNENKYIVELCGYFYGTQDVVVYNPGVGIPVASASVESSGDWSCTSLTSPVLIEVGTVYNVFTHIDLFFPDFVSCLNFVNFNEVRNGVEVTGGYGHISNNDICGVVDIGLAA